MNRSDSQMLVSGQEQLPDCTWGITSGWNAAWFAFLSPTLHSTCIWTQSNSEFPDRDTSKVYLRHVLERKGVRRGPTTGPSCQKTTTTTTTTTKNHVTYL